MKIEIVVSNFKLGGIEREGVNKIINNYKLKFEAKNYEGTIKIHIRRKIHGKEFFNEIEIDAFNGKTFSTHTEGYNLLVALSEALDKIESEAIHNNFNRILKKRYRKEEKERSLSQDNIRL